ncbi:hypothetical protein Q2T40_10270 [Winogradskyella maritima]|uniref:MORN repeat protein n=1 Tax=Winogradskyella maritima TaxID=1517766 RepID=A0ABV8AK58_9FLAO|nr:hypothetical protein [Winogradskyella maritima]
MKKIVLLFTAMLITLTSVAGAEKTSATLKKDLDLTSRYRYTQPVTFVERGVEFLIFADGSFDFNTDLIYNSPRRSTGLYFLRNTRRSQVNVTLGAPGHVNSHFGSRGVLITHDRLGRVRRVGNFFVNYDRWGRVSRIGNVYMSYRHGYLRQVGGLTLQYNRRGRLIHTRGFVNFNNQHCNIQLQNGWDDDDRFDDDRDDNFYYFKQDGKVKKHKKLKQRRFKRDDD